LAKLQVSVFRRQFAGKLSELVQRNYHAHGVFKARFACRVRSKQGYDRAARGDARRRGTSVVAPRRRRTVHFRLMRRD
jgi:hypothetical protein